MAPQTSSLASSQHMVPVLFYSFRRGGGHVRCVGGPARRCQFICRLPCLPRPADSRIGPGQCSSTPRVLLPSLAAPLMRECESRINAPPSPAATPWTRSRTTSGSRATSVFSGSIGGFRLGKRVQRPNDRVQKSTTEQKNRTEHEPYSCPDIRREAVQEPQVPHPPVPRDLLRLQGVSEE